MNFNMNMYGILYKNFTNNDKVKQAKEKLKNNELVIDDILKDQELVNSFKITFCQLLDVLSKENMMKLIKNVITFPEEEDFNGGYKFPFNSCEILSTDNMKIIDKFFEDSKKVEKPKYQFDKDEENEESLNIDKFYANSEDKKLSLKKLEVAVSSTKAKLEQEVKNINDMFNENEEMKESMTGEDQKVEEAHFPKENEDSSNKKVNDDNNEIIKKLLNQIMDNGESKENDKQKKENESEKDSDQTNEEECVKNGTEKESQPIQSSNSPREATVEPTKKEEKEKENEKDSTSKVQDIISEDTEVESFSANKPNKANLPDIEDKLIKNGVQEQEDTNRTLANQIVTAEEKVPETSSSKTLPERSSSDQDYTEQEAANSSNEDSPRDSLLINTESSINNNESTNSPTKDTNQINLDDITMTEVKANPITANTHIENLNTDPEFSEPKSEIDIYLEQSRYPLLDYLFSFVKADEELDHVLVGYFAKIFNSLFMNKTVQFVKYLFERPEIILSMVNHFNRFSIIECLIKLIKYDTDAIILFDRKSCDEVKEEVFKEIFDYIDNRVFNMDENPESEILHCITEFFLECLEDKRTFVFFIKCPKFSLKLFETFLHPTLSKQIYVIGRYLDKVYSELSYKPPSKQETRPRGLSFKGESTVNYSLDKEEDNSLECYYFLELFTSMIDYLFSRFKDETYGVYNYFDKEMDNTFGEKQKKLGLSKLHIMNLIYQILKHTFFVHENHYFNYEEDFFIEFYEKIINSDFFSVAVKYFFEFPWNNMYQNIFLDIINEVIMFSHFNRTLVEHVLYEIGFLEEIILCVVDEKYSCISKFQFRSNEIQNGFLTFIIEIAYNVKLYSYNNAVLLNIIDKTNKFDFFYTYFVEPSKVRFLKGVKYDKKDKFSLGRDKELQHLNQEIYNAISDQPNFFNSLRNLVKHKMNSSEVDEESQRDIDSKRDYMDNIFWKPLADDLDLTELENDLLDGPFDRSLKPGKHTTLISPRNKKEDSVTEEDYYDNNYWKPKIDEVENVDL
eukprot:CAMPEP_0170517620 /NCGR_PEP_ID=MMETSP0209-20121228/3544_1 /TAXON_ID=665100 ORGANISM="Litonotus pictus, Strain P1" /NCGR_SAMPLE_ID=MMETSP0209 /ASSEMBLY_ACC=CAM_ASM_000301 /LENGTH=1020 /DNA_ID=CAMNT_0010802909 /DNA_START=17 /DNA_END=3079 /DNA_ORIENTATION=+